MKLCKVCFIIILEINVPLNEQVDYSNGADPDLWTPIFYIHALFKLPV